MVNRPTVSICIPTYNGREHLKECLDSIRAQSFQDFEVVICDDQSSDGTLNLARELAEGDARFRFISNPRRFGLVGNWNNCIDQARGEWIKFVFQDDLIFSTCLEKLVAACQREGKNFGFCGRAFLFEDGVSAAMQECFVMHKRRLNLDYQQSPVISAEFATQAVLAYPGHNLVGEPTVALIHQSVFLELGPFDEALIQLCDAEFWSRVMVNQGAVFVAEDLAVFRVHAKSTTAANHDKRVFRMNTLDPLVIRYRLAFHRHFKPARWPGRTGKSRWRLRQDCAVSAAHIWRGVKAAIRSGDASAAGTLAEWQAVTRLCPGINLLTRCGQGIIFFHRIIGGITRKISQFRQLTR